ncbi:MAG: FAD-dependent oxidoreductase [Azospirillaceae bacterium]
MRIAVVGAGITGLGCAWALDRAGHEVVVYEKAGRPGGHSNTVEAPRPDGSGTVPVDTGFIVFNDRTYPNLCALFDMLGVESRPSTMSFAVSARDGALEYSGTGLTGLFAQRRNLARPGHWGMIRDVLRFYREAPTLLDGTVPAAEGPSLGDYLRAGRYGRAFVDDHLLPMGAAIWSATVAEMMRFPAASFVRFFANHGLLSLDDRPRWRTVAGGSRAYVAKLTAPLGDRLRTGAGVTAVARRADGVVVRDADGHADRFDHVVLACHADQALAMMTAPLPEEADILGAVRFEANRAVLHADPSLMPRRRRAWASWNYMTGRDASLTGAGDAPPKTSVTYWMNSLQGIDPAVELFVSLNPLREPDPARTHAAFDYDHPQFDAAAVAAQDRLGRIQGADRLWFCGAWCGYGFHEDGLSAGLAVAEALGARRPWSIEEVSPAGRNATPAGTALQDAAE